jgi:hypothetical protein
MNFRKSILTQAINQTIGSLLLEGEEIGARKCSAVAKAITEVQENDTMRFDKQNKVLRFTSRHSKKRRIVTAYGCAMECQCQARYSYHQAAYAIVSRYFELDKEASEPSYLQQQVNSDGKRKDLQVGRIRI